jgi:hypothetical protein
MFLHVVGHNQRFMVIEMTFRRSVETISHYFHEVLYAVSEFHNKIDDITNIHPGQGPMSCIGPRGWYGPS